MDAKTKKIIDELLISIKERCEEFSGIYLFGSQARGDNSNDSDYDLAIIIEKNIDYRKKNNIRDLISEVMTKYDAIIDNPFIIKSELESSKMPLYEIIKNEGFYFESKR